MSVSDLDLAMTLVAQSCVPATFVGPQPASRIAKAQCTLGITFPPSFLEFVSRYGCGAVGPEEFYGILADDFESSSVPDCVWLTMKIRNEGFINSNLIIIGSIGNGAEYVLDLSQQRPDGECPVLEWWPGADDEDQCLEPISEDFGAFFLQITREAIDRHQRRESKNAKPSDES